MALSQNTFLVGVISSITASILVLAASWLITKIIIPKIRGIMLRVPNIAGEWESVEKSANGQEIKRKLEISQYGVRIKAKLIRKHHLKRIFLYNGTFQSGQLVLNFEEQGGEGYIVGALVLKLSANRQSLNGKALYFNHNTGQFVCSERSYKKC